MADISEGQQVQRKNQEEVRLLSKISPLYKSEQSYASNGFVYLFHACINWGITFLWGRDNISGTNLPQ